MAKFILSAFADEYSSDFDTQLNMLNENGVGCIEPRNINGKNISELTDSECEEVKKKLDTANIRVNSIGSPLGKIPLDGDFEEHLALAEHVFSIANCLEAKNIRVFSFYPKKDVPIAKCREEVLDKLGRMLRLAERYGVCLCHENEAKIYGEPPEACLDLLTVFSGQLRCVFDMGNFVLDQHRPFPDAYELLRDHIEYFHIKDSLYRGAIVPPGKGEASIREILTAHRSYASKDIVVTLEPHLETFDGLHKLKGKDFENPYKFENQRIAFLTALNNLKEIIQ